MLNTPIMLEVKATTQSEVGVGLIRNTMSLTGLTGTPFQGEKRHAKSVFIIIILLKSLRATGFVPSPLVKTTSPTHDLIAFDGEAPMPPLGSFEHGANSLAVVAVLRSYKHEIILSMPLRTRKGMLLNPSESAYKDL